MAGPTAGAISTNPAAYIPNDGLAIAQVNELRSELSTKHPLLTAATPLGQSLVNGLSSDLAARATTVQLSAGLAQKQDAIVDGGLAQSKVANLVTDLASKASSASLVSGLATTSSTAAFRRAKWPIWLLTWPPKRRRLPLLMASPPKRTPWPTAGSHRAK